MSRDHNIEESRDFVGGVLLSLVTTLLSLGSIGLIELEIMTFVISVPIPFPIPIPMPRLLCRGLQMAMKKTLLIMQLFQIMNKTSCKLSHEKRKVYYVIDMLWLSKL